jgi:elongation factor P--(R)-beta-lysine ligase
MKSRNPAPKMSPDEILASTLQLLRSRHALLRVVRDFFYDRDYLEVETPNLMKTAAPDPNIEPLQAYVCDRGPFFLHTSPEMGMKKLLRYGHGRIFQVCKVYRVEEHGEIHNTEFTMLEWYREGDYVDAMAEVEDLIVFVAEHMGQEEREYFEGPWKVYDLAELFAEKTGINPFMLERDHLFSAMREKGFRGLDDRDMWNDLFFKLFIQEVEPGMPKGGPYFIKDWPLSVSTMAKRRDPNRVERFELYMKGLEIANGYTELLDISEQRERFDRDNRERKSEGRRTFSVDEEFLEALSVLKGSYGGVSVGLDRLLMVLMGKERIADVLAQRLDL